MDCGRLKPGCGALRSSAPVCFWPSEDVLTANFIARELSLRGHALTGRFRASISESWRARLGKERKSAKGWLLTFGFKLRMSAPAESGLSKSPSLRDRFVQKPPFIRCFVDGR